MRQPALGLRVLDPPQPGGFARFGRGTRFEGYPFIYRNYRNYRSGRGLDKSIKNTAQTPLLDKKKKFLKTLVG
ncbi:hypothetical protein [Thiocystis violacea]|uniref:hypothetical protein n=1 Tax=Thiocystis violacea TaxID=13725 RepID=UPI0019080263|nr:hypothetical protein [Thiocystis violacea]